MNVGIRNQPDTGCMAGNFRWLIAKYAFALLCVGLATWGRMELGFVLDDNLPFGTYFLAVIFTSWLGGTGPALICLSFSVLAAGHFVIEPANSLFISEPASQLSLLVFALVGIVSIGLFHGLERKTKLAAQSLERIELLNKQLTAADRIKDEFISLLAHELRNPLAPMQSAAELLQQSALSETEVSKTGQLLSRHLLHIRHLVDDLFDVSRYQRGQLELHCAVVDIREPIGEAIEFVNTALNEKSQILKVLMPHEPLRICIDRVRITQAVANLLVNAIKFTPNGGHICLVVERDLSSVRIVVTDSGIGIEPSMQEMIFEPFNQIVPGRARLNGGLGLGLTLVKKLVELHHGNVSVASPGLGRGSSFALELPLAEEPSPASPIVVEQSLKLVAEVIHSHEERPDDPSRRRKVLIVDDNQDASHGLATLLRLNGFVCETCHDGISAIQAAHESTPDFILLDIGLPNMDGYEVASKIRELQGPVRSTLIAVTGWGGQEHLRKSREAGIEHHLVKPVLLKDLLELMKPNGFSTVSAHSSNCKPDFA